MTPNANCGGQPPTKWAVKTTFDIEILIVFFGGGILKN